MSTSDIIGQIVGGLIVGGMLGFVALVFLLWKDGK